MTIAQMRLFLSEGERIKRQERAAFISDVYTAAAGVMGGGEAVQQAIERLQARRPIGE